MGITGEVRREGGGGRKRRKQRKMCSEIKIIKTRNGEAQSRVEEMQTTTADI